MLFDTTPYTVLLPAPFRSLLVEENGADSAVELVQTDGINPVLDSGVLSLKS
jgi:hypothetical protein